MRQRDSSIIGDLTRDDEAILDAVWARVATEWDVSRTEKHLSGQHNQQSHAGGGGAAGFINYDPAGVYKDPNSRFIDMPKHVKQGISKALGREVSDKEIADLVAAPDGSTVTVAYSRDSTSGATYVSITTEHEFYRGKQDRLLMIRSNGEMVMKNEYFHVWGRAPKGFGASVLNRQVHALRAFGAKKIKTRAMAGEQQEDYGLIKFNGYYTWPRLGYDGKIPPSAANKLPDAFRDATKVSELMRTPEGRNWWRENGDTFDAEFDLDPNSQSSMILQEYVFRRADK